MCSIRKQKFRAACGVAVVVAAVGGCQRANQPQVAELNPTPIIEDQAMQIRDWRQSSALYPNGDVVAGPTLFAYEPRRGMPEYNYYYADIGTYFLNVALLPYRFVQTPPWREAVYPGEVIPPSYTAVPALPPEPIYNDPPLPAPGEDRPMTPPSTQPGM